MADYEKYVGTQIQVEELEEDYKGKKYKYVELKKGDPVVDEIIKATAGAVRVILPGMAYTLEYRADRLNLHVEKQEDGTYKITSVSTG